MSTDTQNDMPNSHGKEPGYSRWWFTALGVGLLIAGSIASTNLFATTLVSILYIAGTMLAGGIMQVLHAFTPQTWPRRMVYLLSGLFYTAAGVLAVYNPLLSAVGVSLGLGILLVCAGLLRVIFGFKSRSKRGWGWIVASGLLTTVSGTIVVGTWPLVSLWLLGLILTIDLIFQGWGFLSFGLATRPGQSSGAHA